MELLYKSMGNTMQPMQPQDTARNRQSGPAKIVNFNNMG